MFSYLRSPKLRKAPEASKNKNRSAVNHGKPTQIWRLSKLPKGISKINITGTSNVEFYTSGCRKRSGCFCWGWMEGATRHSLRKNSLEKVTPQGGCRWKGTTFGGPILEWVVRSRHKNWKTVNPVGIDSKKFYKNSRGVIFWYKNPHGFVWWIQSEAYCF